MKKNIVFLLAIISLVIMVGCGKEQKKSGAPEKKGIKVVTTFYPMYDFTQKIVGNNGDVSVLMSGEVEPHDYEPSAKDIAKIQEADVFVYNSKEMETWVPSVLKNIDRTKVKIVEASTGIELLSGEAEDDHDHGDEEDYEEHHHEIDPHIWLSPVLAKKASENILKGIVSADQTNQDQYKKNYQVFIDELSELDSTFKNGFEKAKNRVFVTQHAAFGYLAKEYKLEQVAIAGINPDSEPSAKALATLEKYVKEHHIGTIFVEQSGSSKVADTIAKATGAKVATLSTLESMSNEDFEAGKDYLSVMKDNYKALSQVIK